MRSDIDIDLLTIVISQHAVLLKKYLPLGDFHIHSLAMKEREEVRTLNAALCLNLYRTYLHPTQPASLEELGMRPL
jgi:hypothetical protein